MRASAILILLAVGCVSLAADAPVSPQAVQGRKAYEQQLKWADAQFDQAVTLATQKRDQALKAARADYESLLKKSMDAALATKNVDEVKRIDGVLQDLKSGEPASLIPPGRYSGKFLTSQATGAMELEWESKGGQLSELAFTPSGGAMIRHKTLTPRTPVAMANGEIKVPLGDWGHDVWTPLSSGGYLVQRFERKTNAYQIGMLKKIDSK